MAAFPLACKEIVTTDQNEETFNFDGSSLLQASFIGCFAFANDTSLTEV